MGHIVYLEKVYECTGKTISEAKTGTFTTPKARRIRELTRYDGKKWITSRMNTGRGPDPWQGSALHPPGGIIPPAPPRKRVQKGRTAIPSGLSVLFSGATVLRHIK